MKIELVSYSPILNGCLVGLVGCALLKETSNLPLFDSVQNPHIPEMQKEQRLIWPCVMPLSGVQQKRSLEESCERQTN
jgi:hypothetical protein